MSRMPVGMVRFSRASIFLARRSARGTPRRRMPIKASLSRSLVFSRISWARRTSVRSISDALMSWAFSRVRGIKGAEEKGSMDAHVGRASWPVRLSDLPLTLRLHLRIEQPELDGETTSGSGDLPYQALE